MIKRFLRKMEDNVPLAPRLIVGYGALAAFIGFGSYVMYQAYSQNHVPYQLQEAVPLERVSERAVFSEVDECVTDIASEVAKTDTLTEHDKKMLAECQPERMSVRNVRSHVNGHSATGLRIEVEGTLGDERGRLYAMDILNIGRDEVPDVVKFRVNGSEYKFDIGDKEKIICFDSLQTNYRGGASYNSVE